MEYNTGMGRLAIHDASVQTKLTINYLLCQEASSQAHDKTEMKNLLVREYSVASPAFTFYILHF